MDKSSVDVRFLNKVDSGDAFLFLGFLEPLGDLGDVHVALEDVAGPTTPSDINRNTLTKTRFTP